MNVKELIQELQGTEKPDRGLDAHLARLIGWRKTVTSDPTRLEGATAHTTKWFRPDGSQAKKIPFFTESFQAAYELAMEFAENSAGGCVKKEDGFMAQFEGHEPVSSKSGPIALCIASLEVAVSKGTLTYSKEIE